MSTELELLREAAKEAKAEFDKLSSQLAELETKKKWSPEGGGWFLVSDGAIIKVKSTEGCKNFGLERDTESEIKDLRKKQEWLNLTHAYACENDGVQDFVYGEKNWSVTDISASITITRFLNTFNLEKTYMTEKDAIEFARLFREGLINFQFQGGE